MVDWVFLILTFAYSGILCYFELPSMINQKQYRELAAFIVLLTTGTFLGFMKFSGKTVPNPADLLFIIFSPLKGVIESLLK